MRAVLEQALCGGGGGGGLRGAARCEHRPFLENSCCPAPQPFADLPTTFHHFSLTFPLFATFHYFSLLFTTTLTFPLLPTAGRFKDRLQMSMVPVTSSPPPPDADSLD